MVSAGRLDARSNSTWRAGEISLLPWPVPRDSSDLAASCEAPRDGAGAICADGLRRRRHLPVKGDADHADVLGPSGARSVGVGELGEVERRRAREVLAPALYLHATPGAEHIAALQRVRRLAGHHVDAVHRHHREQLRALPAAHADLVLVAGLAHHVGAAFVPHHGQPPVLGAVEHGHVREAADRQRLRREGERNCGTQELEGFHADSFTLCDPPPWPAVNT